jgi:two-component system, NtrC family, response regulator AtoC
VAERILIVDGDDSMRESLELALSAESHEVASVRNAATALEQIEARTFDVVLCDLGVPGLDGMELLPQLARRAPAMTLLVMSADAGIELASEALRLGAYDCLVKPIQPSELRLAIRRARDRARLRRSNLLLQREVVRAVGERPIVAASLAMIELLEVIERAAAFKAAVLLSGESGTGKEVLARAIHAQSDRRHEPFVAASCGEVSETLLESQLFGHAKGAVVGADRPRLGLFQEADGGTLFLDEISELAPALQTKLVHVLQEEVVRPLGDSKSRPLDVRVIAATTRDLEHELAAGRFREDLFRRLEPIHVRVPSLRERREDIPLLVDHFLAQLRASLGRPVRGLEDVVLERLVAHSWPGNIRELENVLERAVIVCRTDQLGLEDLPPQIAAPEREAAPLRPADLSLRRARTLFEADVIRRALEITGGNRTRAARLLEISHRALLYKIKAYRLRDGPN